MRGTARALLAALAAVAPLTLAACVGEERPSADTISAVKTAALGADEVATFEYVIDYGTGIALDAGQVVEIMPADLTAKVGDSIRLINKDTRDFMVGPFFIAAGSTLGMRFTRAGTLSGACDLNPQGEIVITVTD